MALKILLADDNITAQKMGSKILLDAGYTVVAVSNGAAAMKKIVAEKPELLILDIYMPGYSGLEVCEKVKNAPETARIPVLLTVTNMEPFNAEDGHRVKADGVLIKPFEATDLIAVVHKLEEQRHGSAEVHDTQKIAAVKEFEDQSYAEWKAEAEEVKTPEMSHEMAAAPALLEHLDEGSDAGGPPAFAVEAPPAPFDMEPVPGPAIDLNAPAPKFDLGHAEPQAAEAEIAPPVELEFTSAPRTGAVEVAPAPELEVTAQETAADVPLTQDAALVTDPSEIVQFATKFGEEHPEEILVGIAMEPPPDAIADVENAESVVETVPPEPSSPHWGDPDVRNALGFSGGAAAAAAPAREPEAAPEVAKVGVDTQPLDVFAEPAPEPVAEAQAPEQENTAPEEEPTPLVVETAADTAEPIVAEAEELPEPLPEPHVESGDITQKLVAQFAAELEAAQAEEPPAPEPSEPEMEPPAEAATAVAAVPDDQHVSAAVSRVLERYKDELIAAIVRELKS